MAGATRLKYSINSRPRKIKIKNKENKTRRTNVKLAIPARKNLCKFEEITEIDIFNSALKSPDLGPMHEHESH